MSDEYPKHLFRAGGPFGLGDKSYSVAGAADEDEEAALLARGWHLSKDGLWDKFDHDGDGKSGGSKKQEGGDLAALRAEYQDLAGKRPFNGWDEATLREKIAELKEAK